MIGLLVVALLTLLAYGHLKRSQWPPLPPGPPADPFIGHFRRVPRRNPHDTYYQWSKLYGKVISLTTLGKTIVVLNSEEAAKELFDKRGANFSERPSLPMLHEIGWGDVLTFTSYSDPVFSRKRKFSQQPFTRQSISQYQALQEEEVSVLLKNILDEPDQFDRHLHQFSTGIILSILYGRRILSPDDPYMQMAEDITPILRNIFRPSLLDVSRLFLRLPQWFPGVQFIRYIEEMKPRCEEIMTYPLHAMQEQLASGIAQPSVISAELDALSRAGLPSPQDVRFLQTESFQLFTGGAGTTWHTLVIFVLCMVLNPDAQKKGQEEIARVVGSSRLPEFTDRDSLPYVECIMKETMRWHPVVANGLPHVSMADEVYEGMSIPAGSTVFANARAMTLDETKFSEPHKFMPERYLAKPEGRAEVLPESVVFGWGRRICPGRYLADATVWLAIARLLATFEICKPLDKNGIAFDPKPEFETSITCHPEPFSCIIKPRSEDSTKQISEVYQHTYHAAHAPEKICTWCVMMHSVFDG